MFILSLIEKIQSGIFILPLSEQLLLKMSLLYSCNCCVNIISNFASILYKYEDFEYRISR